MRLASSRVHHPAMLPRRNQGACMSAVSDDCIFCRIVRGEMGTEFVAESAQGVAFRDLHPQAPTHVLVVSKRHYRDVTEIAGADPIVAASLINLAVEVAQK